MKEIDSKELIGKTIINVHIPDESSYTYLRLDTNEIYQVNTIIYQGYSSRTRIFKLTKKEIRDLHYWARFTLGVLTKKEIEDLKTYQDRIESYTRHSKDNRKKLYGTLKKEFENK